MGFNSAFKVLRGNLKGLLQHDRNCWVVRCEVLEAVLLTIQIFSKVALYALGNSSCVFKNF